MTRAIIDYVHANEDSLKHWETIDFTPTPEKKLEAMNGISDWFEGVAPGSYNEMLFHTEGAWEDLLKSSGWADVIGDGSELD